jgi:DNA-directed RNA polymerase subunit RPC12/RpoP
MIASRTDSPRIALKLVRAASTGHAVSAPPVLIASLHSIDYTCARCGTVLMHADYGQVHNLVILCNECGSYNSTDA